MVNLNPKSKALIYIPIMKCAVSQQQLYIWN